MSYIAEASKSKEDAYSKPCRAIHPLFPGSLVLQLNSRKEKVPRMVVGRHVFAEKEKVGSQTASLKDIEPREEVDGGLGETDAEEAED